MAENRKTSQSTLDKMRSDIWANIGPHYTERQNRRFCERWPRHFYSPRSAINTKFPSSALLMSSSGRLASRTIENTLPVEEYESHQSLSRSSAIFRRAQYRNPVAYTVQVSFLRLWGPWHGYSYIGTKAPLLEENQSTGQLNKLEQQIIDTKIPWVAHHQLNLT